MSNGTPCAHINMFTVHHDEKPKFIVIRCSECKAIITVLNEPEFSGERLRLFLNDISHIKGHLNDIIKRLDKK